MKTMGQMNDWYIRAVKKSRSPVRPVRMPRIRLVSRLKRV